jgi:hypothetical protein
MRNLLLLIVLFSGQLFGQQEAVIKTSSQLHQWQVTNDSHLASLLDNNLSYGHSNGWVESKEEMLQNLATGKMKYIDIKEDSVSAGGDEHLVNLRFKATITAVLNGNQMTLNLKVLEVWRKGKEGWLLFGRQAVRSN